MVERPNLPMLLDSGSVIGNVADPAQALEGSKYLGRVFYLKRADWARTRYPDVISRSEADSYKRHGKSIVLNFEDAAANWCLGGYDVGRNRGDVSAAELKSIDCENAVVYCSIDFRPANGAEMDRVMECLRGFGDSALGKRGRAVYGFAPTMREAARRGLADYFWMCGDIRETYPGRAYADVAPLINIWQQNNEQPRFAGVQIDDNYIYKPDYGQWKPAAPQPDTEEIDVSEATQIAEQLFGPEGKGWPILGVAVETDPARHRYLVEAVAVILTQIAGDPNFAGWEQLGDGKDSAHPKRTIVDALAHIKAQNAEILALLKGGK